MRFCAPDGTVLTFDVHVYEKVRCRARTIH